MKHWPLLLLILLYSCSMKKKADIVFYNGTVYTVDKNFRVAEAFAVSNGKIIAVGSTSDILDQYEGRQKIELRGRTVYPGFIDAHCHFFGYGTDLVKCNLYGTKSFREVLNNVIDYAKTNKFEWILGRGWDQNDWEVKDFPTNEELDSLFPHTPVFLVRVDGHAVLCNSTALKQAGINMNTEVSGGEVLKSNGKLTGILIDNAVELVRKKIPPFTKEFNEQGLINAQHNCFASGLTTVDDAGLNGETIALIAEMQNSGKLKMRMYAMISDDERTVEYFLKHGTIKTDRLNVRSIKTYADGALGSRGACLLQSYSDMPNHSGFLLHEVSYFKNLAAKARQSDFQLCTHAIGDSAARTMLQIYSENLEKGNNKRWRIEHCQVVSPNDLKMFGDYNIIPSVQPTHATSDMYWAGQRLGNERLKSAYAYNDLLQHANGVIAFGTDFPVEDINPINTFYAAVARKDLKNYPDSGFQPENKVSREATLKAMTSWAAYSNFEENEKGSIENGKFADFVILDSDIMKINEDKIPLTKVVATYIDGEKVFGD